MALQHDVNNNSGVHGGAEVMFCWKQLLVAAGWTVEASGGGAGSGLYSAVGDVLATIALCNVSRAWCRLRAPSSMVPRREFIWLRGSGGDADPWIQVSAEDGFTGGAPDEQTPPTATDQQNIWGAGTAGLNFFFGATTYRFHIVAQDAAPWGWYVLTLSIAGDTAWPSVLFEPMAPGSYPAADDDPAVYYAHWNNPWSLASMQGVAVQGWYAKDLGGEAWKQMATVRSTDDAGATFEQKNLGVNPYNGRDSAHRMMFGRSAGRVTEIGWKGWGANTKWCGVPGRANGTTQSDPATGKKRRIVVNDCALLWPDVVPLLAGAGGDFPADEFETQLAGSSAVTTGLELVPGLELCPGVQT